jgi:hypothetical protein
MPSGRNNTSLAAPLVRHTLDAYFLLFISVVL